VLKVSLKHSPNKRLTGKTQKKYFKLILISFPALISNVYIKELKPEIKKM